MWVLDVEEVIDVTVKYIHPLRKFISHLKDAKSSLLEESLSDFVSSILCLLT